MIIELTQILGILVAAISTLVLGGIWYSPALFGRIWINAEGRAYPEKKAHNKLTYVIAFLFSLLAATIFSWLLEPKTNLSMDVGAGFVTGLGWVATSFGINYVFAQRSWKLFLIDAGYHILQFTLYGLILGLWP